MQNQTDSTREAVRRFIARRGHGGIKELADASGVSRQTIGRFKDGGKAEDGTVYRLAEALKSIAGETAGENKTLEPEWEDRFQQAASLLEDMAASLRITGVPYGVKARKCSADLAFLKSLLDFPGEILGDPHD